ncbi:peptide-methionine (R)-S-oxide reductase MsrB [Bartonella sp. DGB2]|uniref:peptide-methionine (R)-S-oxide reductase MsrB n=1 Tax=Bartonella sp. DGB2 TaxID=3388426 RepID=UPI0039902398
MQKRQKPKIYKSDAEWRALLTEDQYKITRQHGTERAFSCPDFNTEIAGIFHCVCCDNPLYKSEAKYNSGTGWPSFFEPINQEAILSRKDLSYGMNRTEVVCAICDAHLGHVFPDGPQPTGLRYCMNGIALTYKPRITEKQS